MSLVMVGHKPTPCHFSQHHNHYLLRNSTPQSGQGEGLLAITTSTGYHCTAYQLPNDSQERALGYGAFGVVWSVADPRDGQKVALKRIPRVFYNNVTAKRVYRELRMLCHLRHDNIISLKDILKTESFHNFNEIYILCELMQTDLHKIIVSPQPLSEDHVKIFLYQMLRGVKYLHSARIIHRDIKPGNMLVNSNCLLKICDFGLARVEDSREPSLTQEVVTQYYRPPELLMECSRYSFAVDMWSLGCTFAELLGRRILFQAPNATDQLDLILNLTGTPSPAELSHAHPTALHFFTGRPSRQFSLQFLCDLIPCTNILGAELLSMMLKFSPESRITAADALVHYYLAEARLRFHSCMCSCCKDAGPGDDRRIHCSELEPCCHVPMSPELNGGGFRRVSDSKRIVWDLIQDYHRRDSQHFRVVLNKNARNYRALINSNVAQARETPMNRRI